MLVAIAGDLAEEARMAIWRTTGIISNYNFSDLHFWRLSAGLVLR
jgi:hypothetical protein